MKKTRYTRILLSLALPFSMSAGTLLPAMQIGLKAESEAGLATNSTYDNWQAFLNEADPATNAITLNSPDKKVTISSGPCEIKENLTLDLNGQSLILPMGEPIIVQSGAVLTINDSSANTGKTYTGQIQSGSHARNLSQAVLTLEGGTVNLNGGIIYSSNQSTHTSIYSSDPDSVLNINGGAVLNGSHFGSIVFMAGSIHMTSGYVLSETGTAVFIDTAKDVDYDSPANFTMSGGSIAVKNVVPYGSTLFLNGAVANISGGVIQYGEQRDKSYDQYSTDYQAAAIEAGLWDNAIVNISGNARIIANSGQQASAIGIRTERSAESYPGLLQPSSSDPSLLSHVHVEGGTISGQAAGIQAWANTHVEMSGGTIENSHIGLVASRITDAGQIDVSDHALIEADENGIGAYVSGGTVNISGGSIAGGIGILTETEISSDGYSNGGVLNITGGKIYGSGQSGTSITPFKGGYSISEPAAVIYNLGQGSIPQTADPVEVLHAGLFYTKSLYPVLVTQNGSLAKEITDQNSPLLVGSGSLFDMMVNYRYLDTRKETGLQTMSLGSQEILGQIQLGYQGLFEYYPDSLEAKTSSAYTVLEKNPGYVYTSNETLLGWYRENKGLTYKLTIDGNGGLVSSNGAKGESLTYTMLQNSIIHLPVATRSGYVFKGYSTSPDGKQPVSTLYEPIQNQSLYAIWGNPDEDNSGENTPEGSPDTTPPENNPEDNPGNQPDNNQPGDSTPDAPDNNQPDNSPDDTPENHPGETEPDNTPDQDNPDNTPDEDNPDQDNPDDNPGDSTPDSPEDNPESSPDKPLWPGYPTPPKPEGSDSPEQTTPPTEGAGITRPGTQYYQVPDDKYYIIYYMPEDESYRTITVTNSPSSIESLGSVIQIQKVPDDNSFQNPIEIFLGVNAQGQPVGIPGNKLPENGPKVSISFHQLSRAIEKPVVAIPIIPQTEMPGTVSIDNHFSLPKSVMEGNDLKMPVENGAILTIANNAKTFQDARVYGADYARTAVAFMSARGLMTGVGNGDNFDLDGVSTRRQFATILYRFESQPNTSGMALPQGVADNEWYTNAAKWAVSNDLMAQGSLFDGAKHITRQDLAVILYRLQGVKPVVDLSLLDGYTDKDQISPYAREAVAWAIEHKIIGQGTHDLIDPLADSKRIEMAAMIQRFILNVYEN